MTAPSSLPSWLPTANRVVKALHRVGLPLGTIHVLTVPGRTSGKPRSTPVSPLIVDGRRYVVAGIATAGWARNVRAAGTGRLARGRRATTVDLVEVADLATRERVMRAFPTEVPHGVFYFQKIGLVDAATPDAFAAAAGEVAVFEITPHVEG